jgi:hypothetical protein
MCYTLGCEPTCGTTGEEVVEPLGGGDYGKGGGDYGKGGRSLGVCL